MIGLQNLIIERNIKVYDLAKELKCSYSNIYDWFRNNRVPKSRLKVLAEKFNVSEEYLNEVVNDINTQQPRRKGFNEYKIIGNIAEIYAFRRNGTTIIFLVDAEDIPKLIELNYRWSATYDDAMEDYYAHSTQYYKDENGKRKSKSLLLTEIIMNHKPVDHIDHNIKNNCKSNLRKVKHIENAKNRRGKNKNNKSGYRNVCQIDGRWIVQIQIDGKNKRLKSFPLDKLEEAGKFAEEMRLKYYGEFAGNN